MSDKQEEHARGRLQQAALALFQERGYERTTAAGIARAAGVTERTFFRHFPDKREVLFDGESKLRTLLTESIGTAPAEMASLPTLHRAFRATVTALEANRAFAQPRYTLIAVTPALRERETAKIAALADALAAALRARGTPALPALLAAQAGMAAFTYATIAWLEDDSVTLDERFDAAFQALAGLLADAGQTPPAPSRSAAQA